MASTKVTDLAAITVAASNDVFYIVDASDTTDDVAGSSKQITLANLQDDLTITESQISDLGAYITDVVSDTTPQLGGQLDAQTNNIINVGALEIDTINGIDLNPGSDVDVDIITVNVTGAPTISWDESQDSFKFSKGIEIDDTTAITFGTGFDARLQWNGTDLVLDYDSVGAGTTDFRIQANSVDVFAILAGGTIDVNNNDIVNIADLYVGQDITHVGDTNTKITFTSDQVNTVTGGSTRFTINNTGVTLSNGNFAAGSNDITGVNRFDYDYAEGTVVAAGNLGTSEAIDWSTGSHWTGTLDNDVTITHTNEVSGQKITLALSYDGVAQRTITWSDVDKWEAGAAPTSPSSAGEVLVVTLIFLGTTCYGSGAVFS